MRRLGLAIATIALAWPLESASVSTGAEIVTWGWGDFGLGAVPAGNDFVSIAAGAFGSVALRADGTLVGWGDAEISSGLSVPPSGSSFVSVASTNYHGIALRVDGTLASWGFSDYGQTSVPSGGQYIAVAAGYGHSVALRANGTLAAWGWNEDGQTDVPLGSTFIAVASGSNHNVAIRTDGSLAAWGASSLGQLNVPMGNNFVAVAANNSFSLALRSDGTLAGWGYNAYGNTNVPSGNNFVAVSAGHDFGVALRSDGSLVAWGGDEIGIGIGVLNVPAGNDYIAISGGGYHGLALRGEPVVSWKNSAGVNSSFQLPGNWLPALLPAQPHTARFQHAGEFGVTFDRNAETNRLQIWDSDVTFDLAGSNYRVHGIGLEGAIVVAPESEHAGSLGITNGTLTAPNVSIASQAGAVGSLDIAGPNAALLLKRPHHDVGLRIAESGTGLVSVLDGGLLEVEGRISLAGAGGGTAHLSVRGENSLATAEALSIGTAGLGHAEFVEGGQMTVAGIASIGELADSSGHLVVSGNHSLFGADALIVGDLGRAEVTVEESGQLVSGSARLGAQVGSEGTATVSGKETRWSIPRTPAAGSTGDLIVGDQGTGVLNVHDEGTIEAGGTATVGNLGAGSLVILEAAKLVSGDGVIGAQAGASGAVSVEGHLGSGGNTETAPSTWELNGNLSVGAHTSAIAELKVKDSALVKATGQVHIGMPGTSEPTTHAVELGGGLAGDRSKLEAGESLVLHESGVLRGRGFLTTPKTINAGSIEIGSERVSDTPEALPRDGVTGYSAAFVIDGDFTQTSSGRIAVTGLSADHKLQPSGNHSTGLLVTGTAKLDGTLSAKFAENFTPTVGDRFAIITAKEIEGKIATFEDAIIPDITDRFLGVNYRRNLVGNDPVLELITLERPRGLTPPSPDPIPNPPLSTAPNLLLITHGTNASADSWVAHLRNEITLRHTGLFEDQWEVVAFDWRDFNGGASDEFNNISFVNFDPYSSANNGINIGESLVRWYQEQGRVFTNVHLLGHSSGSWLVDSIADSLRDEGMAQQVHLTLFDAFTPPSGIRRQDGGPLQLGETADFAEHYFHRSVNLSYDGLPFTDSILPHAVNVELTLLSFQLNPFSSHAYPYEWYQQRTEALREQPNLPFSFGPRLAQFYTGVFPSQENPLSPGSHFVLFPSDEIGRAIAHERITLVDVISITTGDVTLMEDGSAILQTQSPAILTSLIDLEVPFWAFEFDFAFLNESPGLLSVYFDGEQVFEFDSSQFGAQVDEVWSSGWIWLGHEYDPGSYSLTFRLDPLIDEQAAMRIENLQFISLAVVTVPEPHTLGLLVLGSFLCTGARLRRLRRS